MLHKIRLRHDELLDIVDALTLHAQSAREDRVHSVLFLREKLYQLYDNEHTPSSPKEMEELLMKMFIEERKQSSTEELFTMREH